MDSNDEICQMKEENVKILCIVWMFDLFAELLIFIGENIILCVSTSLSWAWIFHKWIVFLQWWNIRHVSTRTPPVKINFTDLKEIKFSFADLREIKF